MVSARQPVRMTRAVVVAYDDENGHDHQLVAAGKPPGMGCAHVHCQTGRLQAENEPLHQVDANTEAGIQTVLAVGAGADASRYQTDEYCCFPLLRTPSARTVELAPLQALQLQ